MRRLHTGRLGNHVTLGGITGLGLAVALWGGWEPGLNDRMSIVTAYLCLLLLTVVLAIGPIIQIRTGRRPTNIYWRRDAALWAVILGLVHLVLGIELTMTPIYIDAFIYSPEPPEQAEFRRSLFALGTITGLAVGILFLPLMAISSDWALRRIGLRWWKRIQRLSYIVFVVTALHGALFQVLEGRGLGLALVMGAGIIVVLVVQIWAYIQNRHVAASSV